MPTPQEIALLEARGRDLEKRSRLLLGADVSGIRGPAGKAAALSGYLSALDGKVPTNYDDMLKAQQAADARAALEAKQAADRQRELDKEARENARRMAEIKARQDFEAKQNAADRAQRKAEADARARQEAEDRKAREEEKASALRPMPPKMGDQLYAMETAMDKADALDRYVDDPANAEAIRLYTPAVKSNMDSQRSDSAWERGLGNLNPFSGSDEEVEVASPMFAMAEQLYAEIRKDTFGSVLTPSDLARAAQNQVAPGDSAERIKSKTKILRDIMQLGHDRLIAIARGQKIDTAGYGRPEVKALQAQSSTGTAPAGAITFRAQ